MKSALLVILPFVAVVSAAQAPEPKPPAAAPPAASAPAPAVTAPQPRPKPTPPPAIEGTVRTPDGKPVDKALVLVQPVIYSMQEPGLVVGRTDAAGKFRVLLKRAGAHRLRVEAPGWAATTVKNTGPGSVVAITLHKGETIEGSLRDGSTGAPLANATVEATDETNGVHAAWEPGAGTVRATTNARGQFRLEGIAPGLHTVSAYLRGFSRSRRSSVPSGGRVDLYAFGGAVLSGVVRDAQERPVAGAVVRVEGELRGWSASAPVVAADAQGRYEVVGLSPGTVRVVARHPDFTPAWVRGVTLERGSEAEIDVVLHRGARVSGRLVAGEDRPVPGRVALQDTDEKPVPTGLDDIFRADAGEDGRFQVTLPPGDHVLAVLAPGFAPRRLEVDVGTGGSPVDVGDVTLEPGLTIRGRVRDKAGLPVAGARVFAHLMRMMMSRSSAEAASEADGSFVLAGLDAGTYRLSVSARGHAEQLKQVEAGATLDVVLAPAATLSGMVVDDAGQAIESFRVAARADRELGPTGPSPRMDSFASADGRFVLEDVPEGTWVVEASAPDRANGVAPAVRVEAGANVDVGRIRLPAGGTIRGVVVDTGGAAVAGASVTVQGASMDWMSGSREASSDPGGAFEIRGVQAGTAEVVAQHPTYAQSPPATVEVEPARPPAEVRLVVSQGGRIEGRVLRRDGSGVSALVTAAGAGGGRRGHFPRATASTAADGSFVIEHVPAGRVTVMVMAGAGGFLQSSEMRELEVREGETTTAEFVSREILVSGHVTRGGAPAPGLRLQLMNTTGRTVMSMAGGAGMMAAPPTGPQRLNAVTDEGGAFAMLADAPGRHHVNVTSVDGKLSLMPRTVEIPDADAFTLDLAFSGVPVSGVVIDRETEQPVPEAYVAARASAGPPGPGAGSARTGVDGRFQLELEPGDYKMSAGADGYAGETTEVTVGFGGVPDLRLAVSRGGSITGRVVDPAGRPLGGVTVSASGRAEGGPGWGGMGRSLPDGSFRIDGLAAGDLVVVAQSDLGAFAMRAGVSPGDEGVTLTLRPGGRVQVMVRGPDGAPVQHAYVRVTRAAGAMIGMFMGQGTMGDGLAEVAAPLGTVELEARKDRLKGTAVVEVTAGGTVPAEITLAEAPPPAPGNR